MVELLNEAAGASDIGKKHSRIFAAANKLWQLASSLVQPGHQLNPESHFFVRWVVLAYYARQLRAFRAIALLLERGLVPEAQKILRPMIESYLHLRFLAESQDMPETARHYLIWEFANDEKLLGFVKEEEKAKHLELMKTLSEAFADERKSLGKEKWKQFTKRGPPMLSVEALAKKFEFQFWYDVVYRRLSGAIHGFNILSYARPSSDLKTFTVNLAPVDDALPLTLDTAIALLMNTSLQVNQIFKLGKEKDLRALDEEHAAWIKERLAEAG